VHELEGMARSMVVVVGPLPSDQVVRLLRSYEQLANDQALVAASAVRTGSRVLEIGCGTGQLSVPLADLGVELTAVELRPHLAALARRNLEQFPQARVLVSSFEEWQLPDRKFDAVICASAFHWLDPEVRYAKVPQRYTRAAHWPSSRCTRYAAGPTGSSPTRSRTTEDGG
jgi:SAM-dependent methyltransferase